MVICVWKYDIAPPNIASPSIWKVRNTIFIFNFYFETLGVFHIKVKIFSQKVSISKREKVNDKTRNPCFNFSVNKLSSYKQTVPNMPYIIKRVPRGYKVCKQSNTDMCFSRRPLPLSRAQKQRTAISLSEMSRTRKSNTSIRKKWIFWGSLWEICTNLQTNAYETNRWKWTQQL